VKSIPAVDQGRAADRLPVALFPAIKNGRPVGTTALAQVIFRIY